MSDKTGKDFDLPQASINRILRAKLPEGVSVTKGAKQAFAKAAGIFVLYVTAAANDFCKDKKRSTISADDVLEALKELDFEEFLEPLRQCREELKAQQKSKRGNSAKAKTSKKADDKDADDDDDDEDDVDDASQGDNDESEEASKKDEDTPAAATTAAPATETKEADVAMANA